jgi:tRNA uridine 5-carboxymethylaminomethyl modification enzyme
MSCNPAMGGIAKDRSFVRLMRLVVFWNCFWQYAIQFKMLNNQRSCNVVATCSKWPYAICWGVENDARRNSNLDFTKRWWRGLLIENGKIKGITTALGIEIKKRSR